MHENPAGFELSGPHPMNLTMKPSSQVVQQSLCSWDTALFAKYLEALKGLVEVSHKVCWKINIVLLKKSRFINKVDFRRTKSLLVSFPLTI